MLKSQSNRQILMSLVVCCASASALLFSSIGWANTDSTIQGFQSWKNSRVDEARLIFEKTQAERPLSSSSSSSSSSSKGIDKKMTESKPESGARLQTAQKVGRADQKLQQAQLNFEVAQELTITDYFVLYLSQLKTREAFIEAAKKLNPEETADIMMSFQKHLTAGQADYDQINPTPVGGYSASTGLKAN